MKIVLVLTLLLLLAWSGQAEVPEAPSAPSLVTQPSRPLPPLAIELRAEIEAVQRSVRDLRVRLDQASTAEEALRLQREIEAVKRDGELRLLSLQAEAHRRAGREAQARTLESAIARSLAPPPAAPPRERSRPAPTSRR